MYGILEGSFHTQDQTLQFFRLQQALHPITFPKLRQPGVLETAPYKVSQGLAQTEITHGFRKVEMPLEINLPTQSMESEPEH